MVGRELPYWRFSSERPDVQKAWDEAFPNPPTEILVYFASPNVDDVFEAWKEEYGSGGLIHRCDGETMNLWLDKDGHYHEEPKPCPYFTGEKKRARPTDGCQPKGRLRFLVWGLVVRGYVGEVWLTTGSARDIQNIALALNSPWFSSGNLVGIPFLLRRVKGQTSYSKGGKRVRVEKYFVELQPTSEYIQTQLQKMQLRALPAETESPPDITTQETPVDDMAGVEPIEGVWEEEADEVETTETDEDVAPGRPYDAETCRKGILARAAAYHEAGEDDIPVSVSDRGILAGTLEDLFKAKPAKQRPALRHSVLTFIFGQPSIKELPGSALRALSDWATKRKGQYDVVTEVAKVEAMRMVEAYEASQGQQQMPLGELE